MKLEARMAFVWMALIVGGLLVALFASRVAVDRAVALAAGTRVPPFVVGITLLAIGTDLPEIANSIVASIADQGDLNVGDSIGSAGTQVTLVLGLLPFVVGTFVVGARRVLRIGTVTVVALLGGAFLLADGFLSRGDAALLFVGWIVGSVVVWRDLPPGAEPAIQVRYADRWRQGLEALLALALVGAGAGGAVWGFTRIAELLDVPTYLLAFFAASIGTSLPELVVDITALRRGERDMAVGDVLGSSFVDSTLSIAAGPLLAPTAITASLAVRGSLAAAVAVALVVVVLARFREHNRWTGLLLLAIYGGFYAALLV
jgi:cation:H+ antiporter